MFVSGGCDFGTWPKVFLSATHPIRFFRAGAFRHLTYVHEFLKEELNFQIRFELDVGGRVPE